MPSVPFNLFCNWGQAEDQSPDSGEPSGRKVGVSMVTADLGLVSMIRQGILALQLLPSNSSAGQWEECCEIGESGVQEGWVVTFQRIGGPQGSVSVSMFVKGKCSVVCILSTPSSDNQQGPWWEGAELQDHHLEGGWDRALERLEQEGRGERKALEDYKTQWLVDTEVLSLRCLPVTLIWRAPRSESDASCSRYHCNHGWSDQCPRCCCL